MTALALHPIIRPPVEGKEEDEVTNGTPKHLPGDGDHVRLECPPGFHAHPQQPKGEQRVECCRPGQCDEVKSTTQHAEQEKVDQHSVASPIDVCFAIMSEAEGAASVRTEFEVCVAFNFGLVILDAFIRGQDAREKREREIGLKELAALVGDFGRDLRDGTREILEVAYPPVGCIDLPFAEDVDGQGVGRQFLEFEQRIRLSDHNALGVFTSIEVRSVLAFDALPNEQEEKSGEHNG